MVLPEKIIAKENLYQLVNSETNQIAFIDLPNTLKIKITVPYEVFEWYVDIYDNNGIWLTSNWYDYYGDKKENLLAEMRESIVEFIDDVTKNDSRIVTKPGSKKSIFQIMKDNKWLDYI